MPKIIAHALVGATIVIAAAPKTAVNKWTLLVGAVLAISPDFDFAIEWLGNLPDFHRGLTHSLVFSIFVGLIICLWMSNDDQRTSVAFSLAYLSHSLLDLATSTVGGVKLFWPLSERYYHLGWTAILELPAGPSPSQILQWAIIETVIFLPIFLIVFWIKKSLV